MSKLAELQQVIDQIRSEITVDSNGVGILSIRATARICDVSPSALLRPFADHNFGSKLCKTLVEHGFQPDQFSVSGVPDMAAYIVIDYYANKAGKNCTEAAKQAALAIGAIGMRQWCREVTGWQKENPVEVSVDTVTVESMFSTMMEMKQQMGDILQVAQNQVATLTAEVAEQKLISAAKQDVIDDMVEKENIREAKFLMYPGLKEATDYALEWDDEVDEEVFFTLRQFCEINEISLTHGQKIQVGKLATDFCRMAVMRKMPKNISGHTLYSSRFEPMVKLAIIEVLNLKR